MIKIAGTVKARDVGTKWSDSIIVGGVRVIVEDAIEYDVGSDIEIDVYEVLSRGDGYKCAIACNKYPKSKVKVTGTIIKVTNTYCDVRDGNIIYRVHTNTQGLFPTVFFYKDCLVLGIDEEGIMHVH